MTAEIPTKRQRGGQPRNQNAKSNRGNRTANRHRFAPGNRLGGAPLNNQNARKHTLVPHLVLLADYRYEPEAVAWIEAHAEALDEAQFTADAQRDRALFAAHIGLTLDALIDCGSEYRHGLFVLIESDSVDREEQAA